MVSHRWPHHNPLQYLRVHIKKPALEFIVRAIRICHIAYVNKHIKIAVCRVDNGFCQGCYNKITVNDTARLMGKSAVIRCGSCQRILYLGER